ncbi:hypothetical protein QFC19_002993 [Naganishia cerealis]|uniref:Uncharacterized protein n=1 Tax=Naganishia cerealis TaxID=610337 RepID=A0ACC2W6T9_9TREE|nr:hypothetical protein QFC19_002993 [Naganishia cerealis]
MGNSALPRGIIITPSSPIKPATQRDGSEYYHSPNTRSPGIYALHDLRQDHKDASSNILLNPVDDNSNTYNLGKGQPTKPHRPFFSSITALESPSQSYTPSGFLTPEPLLSAGPPTFRSASLPIEAQQNSTQVSTSPQARSSSSAAGQISPRFLSADDTWSDRDHRVPTLNRKAIRKTRSFSEMLSRNRRIRSENGVDTGQQPIITWKSERKTRVVETPDTVTPPSTSQTSSPKKKSSNILKTAVDFFQFRKSRSRASSDAGRDMPLAIPSRDSNALDTVLDGREATAAINSGLILSMSSAPVPLDTSRSTALMNVDGMTALPRGTWWADKGSSEFPVREASYVAVRTTPKASPEYLDPEGGTKGSFTTSGDFYGTTNHYQHMENGPATVVDSPSPVSQSRVHSPVDDSLKSSMLSLPRAKVMSLTDAPFKRPHMSPRAQSANSTSQSSNTSPASDAYPGSWHGNRPRSEASVSRSTTIRAVRPSHSQRSPDVYAKCLSSSLSTSRQSSVDGLALESSEPMSILRSSVPIHLPTTPDVGSPSVSFAGGTPRMSISSSTSRAESPTSSGRPRGYTSVSQDNFHNALSPPVANSKSARPRSSTLFSTTPGWLATGTLNSPEKKRSSVMRRLSAGLTGNVDENKRTPFPTSTQDLSPQTPDYFGTGDPVPPPTVDPLRELPDRQPETSTEEWMAQISQMIPRSSLASVLASK